MYVQKLRASHLWSGPAIKKVSSPVSGIVTSPPEGVAKHCFHPVCMCVSVRVCLCVNILVLYFSAIRRESLGFMCLIDN